ncbi:BON domain-containing protein [Pedobacter sp. PLR]|uniref:BON domain-containing protein n=1 Tax=Pedobacter sp. PLR TaxID=2994465 RepID=UPI0022466780|nr:BON domain-containing protein [Pedobacter sp. PLR]MCX2452416.1 BON domain-containing protein [Pedobacter sp. PLR]
MKKDAKIQKDVMDELKWEPLLDASEIGVAMKNGIVTLSGEVDSYVKKMAAERATKRVSGVKAVAEEIQVILSTSLQKTDADIAAAILNVLKWNSLIQEDKIKINVEGGIVRLEGEVEWDFQRKNIKKSIEYLSGVRMVVNLIQVKPLINSSEIKQKITSAFRRSANLDSKAIEVTIADNKVILQGKVRSFSEKEDAEDAAWSAPGVLKVENRIEVEEPVHKGASNQ